MWCFLNYRLGCYTQQRLLWGCFRWLKLSKIEWGNIRELLCSGWLVFRLPILFRILWYVRMCKRWLMAVDYRNWPLILILWRQVLSWRVLLLLRRMSILFIM